MHVACSSGRPSRPAAPRSRPFPANPQPGDPPLCSLTRARSRRLFGCLTTDDDIGCDLGDVADGLVQQAERLLPDFVDRGGEGIADGHGEHPGRDNVEDGATLLCLGDGPIKRSCAFAGAVDPDDDAMLRWLMARAPPPRSPQRVPVDDGVHRRSCDGSVNQDRAVGVGGAVLADRADQHADELAVSPTADNQEVGTFGGLDQERGGMSLHHSERDLDVGVLWSAGRPPPSTAFQACPPRGRTPPGSTWPNRMSSASPTS